jgi:hypothetical protein
MGLNSATSSNAPFSDKSDVQALNQVNQAISEETKPAIITEEVMTPIDPVTQPGSQSCTDSFMPYLLVHHLGAGKRTEPKPVSKDNNLTNSGVIDTSNQSDKGSYMEVYVKGVVKAYKPSPYEPSPASSVAGVPGSIQSHDSQENMSISGSTVSSLSRSTRSSQPDGAVIQCIPLLSEVGPNHYVHSITPSSDGHHIIVVTAPKAIGAKLGALQVRENVADASHGGCVLVYKVKQDMECITLDDTPCRMSVIDDMNDAVISLTLLPQELGGATSHLVPDSRTDDVKSVQGSVVVTTYDGQVKIITLDNLKVVGTISPPEGERFISATFCTGWCYLLFCFKKKIYLKILVINWLCCFCITLKNPSSPLYIIPPSNVPGPFYILCVHN